MEVRPKDLQFSIRYQLLLGLAARYPLPHGALRCVLLRTVRPNRSPQLREAARDTPDRLWDLVHCGQHCLGVVGRSNSLIDRWRFIQQLVQIGLGFIWGTGGFTN